MLAKLFSEFDIQVIRYEKKEKTRKKNYRVAATAVYFLTRCPLGVLKPTASIHHQMTICEVTRALL